MKARFTMQRILATFLVVFLVVVSTITPVRSEPKDQFSSLSLLVGGVDTRTSQEVPPILLGLQLKLADGWKVYWRSPGDAGQSMEIDWNGSTNIADVALRWPAPTRYVEAWGLEVFGYSHEVVLPLLVTREKPDQPSHLVLNARYSVCSDICVPYEETIEQDLPQPMTGNPANEAVIAPYLDRVAKPNGAYGMMIEEAVRESEQGGKGVLRVTATSPDPRFSSPDLFIESVPGFRFPAPQLHITQNRRHVEFRIPYEINLAGQSLADKSITVTLVNGKEAVEATMDVPQGFARSTDAEDESAPGLASLLFASILGGLILNLMPCVLPVLSLKILSLVKQQSVPMARVRISFLVSALGILTSFMLLAFAVIVARETGIAVGWGFHFQEPSFLAVLAFVMVLFAGSMWEWMHIRLPSLVNTKLQSGHVRIRAAWLGDFAAGMFATLLATPCSAPFLGAAVGFALARGPQEILLIFMMLGVGLALPYLLGMLFPQIVRLMPRPGAWMVRIKHVLGVFLLGTAVWLVWVVMQQTSMAYGVLLFGICGLFMMLLRVGGRIRPLYRLFFWWMFAVLAVWTAALPHLVERPARAAPAHPASQTLWQEFQPERIASLVKQGKVVLVEVSADWCLTCSANELFVLNTPEISAALSENDVVAMRADWTRRDEGIQSYLAGYGRYGVPFTIIYGPGSPDGKPLSELLSKEMILEGLAEARKPVD